MKSTGRFFVGAGSPANRIFPIFTASVRGQGNRVLLTHLTYMAQANLSTGSRSLLLPVGEAAPTATASILWGSSDE
jgi:hypothetical protein